MSCYLLTHQLPLLWLILYRPLFSSFKPVVFILESKSIRCYCPSLIFHPNILGFAPPNQPHIPLSNTATNRFCGLKGHEMFCHVERAYIEDGFNLYGLRACVSNYSDCLDLILDRIAPEDSDDSHLTQSACTLYGLLHARYIVTTHGLDSMYNKVSFRWARPFTPYAYWVSSFHWMKSPIFSFPPFYIAHKYSTRRKNSESAR